MCKPVRRVQFKGRSGKRRIESSGLKFAIVWYLVAKISLMSYCTLLIRLANINQHGESAGLETPRAHNCQGLTKPQQGPGSRTEVSRTVLPRFPSYHLIMRVPFSLIFSFDSGDPQIKRGKGYYWGTKLQRVTSLTINRQTKSKLSLQGRSCAAIGESSWYRQLGLKLLKLQLVYHNPQKPSSGSPSPNFES